MNWNVCACVFGSVCAPWRDYACTRLCACVSTKTWPAQVCFEVFFWAFSPRPPYGHIKTLPSIWYRLEKPAVQFAPLWSWSQKHHCCFQLSRRRLNCIERRRDSLIAWHDIGWPGVIFHIMRRVSLPVAPQFDWHEKHRGDGGGSLTHLLF